MRRIVVLLVAALAALALFPSLLPKRRMIRSPSGWV